MLRLQFYNYGDMRGHFHPPALPEDCLVFLIFVGRRKGKHMKAMTFDKSFAEKEYVRASHRESFADGFNNTEFYNVLYIYNSLYTYTRVFDQLPYIQQRKHKMDQNGQAVVFCSLVKQPQTQDVPLVTGTPFHHLPNPNTLARLCVVGSCPLLPSSPRQQNSNGLQPTSDGLQPNSVGHNPTKTPVAFPSPACRSPSTLLVTSKVLPLRGANRAFGRLVDGPSCPDSPVLESWRTVAI